LRLREVYVEEIVEVITTTFYRRPTTFRVNTLKSTKTETESVLEAAGFMMDTVPWFFDAYILRNRSKRELIDLPIYTEGKIYIQSLASMVPPLVLDPQPGERVLDLTAAPGSKTGQIAAMMERRGELVANDKSKIRFFKLKHNLEKLGVLGDTDAWKCVLRMEPGTGLVREYPTYFDRILIDAPCSGEARFDHRNPKTFAYWSLRKVKEMIFTQRKLLFSAWQALRPGGVMVYSTCTISPEENELQVATFLERHDDAVLEPVDIEGIGRLPMIRAWQGRELSVDVTPCLRVVPTTDMESFFVAKIRKLGHT